jgi:hypothetical protein
MIQRRSEVSWHAISNTEVLNQFSQSPDPYRALQSNATRAAFPCHSIAEVFIYTAVWLIVVKRYILSASEWHIRRSSHLAIDPHLQALLHRLIVSIRHEIRMQAVPTYSSKPVFDLVTSTYLRVTETCWELRRTYILSTGDTKPLVCVNYSSSRVPGEKTWK